jgi:hypothetical protein
MDVYSEAQEVCAVDLKIFTCGLFGFFGCAENKFLVEKNKFELVLLH